VANGVTAARLFVKSGTLAQEGGRDAKLATKIEAKAGDGSIDLPVLILVTTGTSGPAEVFAAALDGNKRAELIGEHTLGRAGLQKLVKLPESRGLWLTYARYLTPDGQAIQGRGLEPDVQVDDPDVEFGAPAPTADPILDAAVERAKTKRAA
jgi:carboxyl-terminal processing protease